MCFPNKKCSSAFDLPCVKKKKKEKRETVQDSALRSLLCGKYVTVRKKGLHGYLRKVVVVPLI